MPIINSITAFHDQMKQWRQHMHKNPELSLQEYETSKFVQGLLDEMGIEYHTGYAGTGVIGVIKNGTSHRTIGLRADMDALAITEEGDLSYKSQNEGVMHACGHDGHTAMLLGAAKYLSQTKNFDGTVYLYFQPAEEGLGGARIMLEDGAFDDFKPDEMYGMHNRPGQAVGTIACKQGALTANSDRFYIKVTGTGGHAARPHMTADTLVTAAHLVIALQTVVSRNVDPFYPAVLSTCILNTGTSDNIIPEYADIRGTVRTVNAETQDLIERRMGEVCAGIGKTFNAKVDFEYSRRYPMCVNHPEQTAFVRQVAEQVVGGDNTHEALASMGGEDFAYFLQKTTGSYFLIGNGDTAHLHTPTYNFNDDILPLGASMFSRLVETRLARCM